MSEFPFHCAHCGGAQLLLNGVTVQTFHQRVMLGSNDSNQAGTFRITAEEARYPSIRWRMRCLDCRGETSVVVREAPGCEILISDRRRADPVLA